MKRIIRKIIYRISNSEDNLSIPYTVALIQNQSKKNRKT